jgi:hypothetical protein
LTWMGVLIAESLSTPELAAVMLAAVGMGMAIGYVLGSRPNWWDFNLLVVGDTMILFTIPLLIAGGIVFTIAFTIHFVGLVMAAAGIAAAIRIRMMRLKS